MRSPSHEVLFEILPGGVVDLKALDDKSTEKHIRYMAISLQKREGTKTANLSSVLHWWYHHAERMSRCPVKVGQARDFIKYTIWSCGLSLDLSTDENWWKDASLLDIVPVSVREGGRREVMSQAYKAALMAASRDNKANLSEPQLHHAFLLMNGGMSTTETPATRGTCSNMKKDFLLRMLGEARVIFKNPRALHITMDGVAAGGDQNDVFVFWLPDRGIAGVGPMQAMY